jgi:hypothetical protein
VKVGKPRLKAPFEVFATGSGRGCLETEAELMRVSARRWNEMVVR